MTGTGTSGKRAASPRVSAVLSRFVPLAGVVAAVFVRNWITLTPAADEAFQAGIFALGIVGLFRLSEARFRVDALGMRFFGAAGIAFFWLVTFAAILIAIRTYP